MASYKLALHSLSFSVLPFSPLYTHTHSDKHLASIWPEQMELVCFADRHYFSSFLRGSCISDCMTEGISNLVRLSQAVVYRRKQISRFPHRKVLTGEKERKNIMQQKICFVYKVSWIPFCEGQSRTDLFWSNSDKSCYIVSGKGLFIIRYSDVLLPLCHFHLLWQTIWKTRSAVLIYTCCCGRSLDKTPPARWTLAAGSYREHH